MRIRVGIQKNNPEYNEVLGYLPASSPPAAAAIPSAAPAPAPAPAASSAPWVS
jgi:hypothetical protein